MNRNPANSPAPDPALPLILESAPEGLLVFNSLGIVTMANSAAHAIFGYPPGELRGQLCETLVPEGKRALHVRLRNDYIRKPVTRLMGAGTEVHGRRLNGEEFPFQCHLAPLAVPGGPPLVAFWIREVLSSHQSERQLHTLHLVARIMASARSVEDAAPRVLRTICEMMAWDAGLLWASAHDKPELRLLSSWVPDGSPVGGFCKQCASWSFLPEQGVIGRAWSSGHPEWIEEVASAPEFVRKAPASRFGITSMCVVPIIYGGRLLGALEFFSRSHRPSDATMLSQLTDIGTTLAESVDRIRVQEALQAREQQVRQSEKLASVGRLAGGIAHDFNNLLTAIIGYSDEGISRVPPDSPLRQDLLEIRRAGERAASLTRQLLAYSRKQILQPRIIDPNNALSTMEPMLRRLLGENVDLKVMQGKNVGAIRVDPSQLEQVILNLALNGRDAMGTGGQLTIETMKVELDADYVRRHPEVAPGCYVMLAVSDTGAGMDETTQAHLFEPFFTTKEVGRGTGLGLATIHGIVNQSGGHIWVYSELGRGTTFKVYFPSVSLAPDSAAIPISERKGGNETILLVEDDEVVRRFVKSVLESGGYRVLDAGRPSEAMQIAQSQASPLPLVISDVMLPGESGRVLCDRLRKIWPVARFLFISGYTENAIVHNGVLDASVDFLGKPFTPPDILAKVRSLLDQKSPAAPVP